MIKTEYDFLTWASFPSSGKIVNDTEWWGLWQKTWKLFERSVTPGKKLTVTVNVKQEGVLPPARKSHISINNAIPQPGVSSPSGIGPRIGVITMPNGTFNWRQFSLELIVPSNVSVITAYIAGGAKGTSWWDDLEIYMDDVLIYSNDFSNYNPIIGAGVGGAGLGAAVPAVAYVVDKPRIEKDPLIAVGLSVLGIVLGGAAGFLVGQAFSPVPAATAISSGAPESPDTHEVIVKL